MGVRLWASTVGLLTIPQSPTGNWCMELVRVGRTMDVIQDALDQGLTPSNDAEYPDSSLGRKLTEAAMLMKRTLSG